MAVISSQNRFDHILFHWWEHFRDLIHILKRRYQLSEILIYRQVDYSKYQNRTSSVNIGWRGTGGICGCITRGGPPGCATKNCWSPVYTGCWYFWYEMIRFTFQVHHQDFNLPERRIVYRLLRQKMMNLDLDPLPNHPVYHWGDTNRQQFPLEWRVLEYSKLPMQFVRQLWMIFHQRFQHWMNQPHEVMSSKMSLSGSKVYNHAENGRLVLKKYGVIFNGFDDTLPTSNPIPFPILVLWHHCDMFPFLKLCVQP